MTVGVTLLSAEQSKNIKLIKAMGRPNALGETNFTHRTTKIQIIYKQMGLGTIKESRSN